MEEAPPFIPVVQAYELVQAIVVLGDRDAVFVGLRDDAELVVGVMPPTVRTDLEDSAPIEVVAVTAENARSLLHFPKLVADAVQEPRLDSSLGFR